MRDDEQKMEFDNNEVTQLLQTLKRVGAPVDFGLRVRSRIAAGRSQSSAAFRFPVFARYAVPLVLLVVVGSYVGYRALKTSPVVEAPVAIVPAPNAAPAGPPIAPIAQPVLPEIAVVPRPDKDQPIAVAPVRAKKLSKRPRPTGWSSDQAVRESRRLYLNGEVPVLDMLANIGIRGTVVSSGLKVDVAAENGIASRSGIRAGDVVEAVDGKTVTEKSSVKGAASGKTVRVNRDGKSVDLILKN